MIYALNRHSKHAPAQRSYAVEEELLERKRQRSASHHGTIYYAQLPDLLPEQLPLPDLEGVACLFDLAQHRGNDHDGQADPEQHEEAAEVTVVACGVEVGDAIDVLDGREYAPLLLGADLAARRGRSLDGGGRIGGDGRGSAATWSQYALQRSAPALANLETPEPPSMCCLTDSSLSWGFSRSMRVGLRGRGE